MFIRERSEAQDREQRQKNKVTELQNILNTHVESIDKTSDMACTMLKSIDAKTTTVISDLKKAESALRSESRSTPGTCASICMHTPDTHVKRGTTTTATSDSDTSQSMHSDGVTKHPAGRASTTDSVSPASQHKKSATVACAPTTTKPAPPRPHAVEPIAPDDDDDKLWSLMLKAKPTGKKSVLYVGNLEDNASEENLREYIEKRSQKAGINQPKIYNCTIFSREEGELGSWAARITIDHTSHEHVCSRYFWPGRVYARPWKFREQSREEEQKRDRQPRPTSPTVAGHGPNVADAGPTTSRGSDIPNQKKPSKPNDP